jgi:hypothetical protein
MILWLLGNHNPSAYVRAYGYKDFFDENKIKYVNFDNLILKNDIFVKIRNILQFVYILFWIIFFKNSYIVIERDLPMRLLRVFELISQLVSLQSRIIYDFDDAMWLEEFIGAEKFSRIMNLSGKVICDNELQVRFLQEKWYGKQILALPGLLPNLDKPFPLSLSSDRNRINICYLGTPSTLSFLLEYSYGIQRFLEKYPYSKVILLGNFQKRSLPLTLRDRIEIRDIKFPFTHESIDDIYLGFAPLIKGDRNSYFRGLHKYRVYSSLGIPSLCLNYGEASLNLINEVDCYLFNEDDDLLDKLDKIFNEKETWDRIKVRCFSIYNPKIFNLKNYKILKNFIIGNSVC